MAEFVKVASRSELPPGGKKLADVDGRAIALFNVDGAFHAIDPMREGRVRNCATALDSARFPPLSIRVFRPLARVH